MSKYWISTAAAAKVKVLVLLYIVLAWKLFGKITQSFGDISVVKGVVIFFSWSSIICLEKHAIKNPMLYTSLSSHLSLLEKLVLDDDIISTTTLLPCHLLYFSCEGKSCLEFLRLLSVAAADASCSVAPHFALSEEATIQLNIPHCVVRLQGSASE